jgi:transcription elongation factor Elf1
MGLGEALKFIVYFLEDHLGEDVQDHLPAELFSRVKELIFEYEELMRRAKASMQAACNQFRPKEQSLLETGECPECGNETVLIGATDEPYCHFCQETVSVRRCQECGQYLPEHAIMWADMCHDCFSYKINRD